MELRSGTLLQDGKYQIIRSLGQGGFGITYLAEQRAVGRYVCIKEFFRQEEHIRDGNSQKLIVISKDRAEFIARFKDKFIKEAKTIAQLNHPNIINIHDIFEENNTGYYVMDYIDGAPLLNIVNSKGVLSEGDAKRYIRQVASALEYIHKKSITHLDVKPENIMVRKEDDCAILIDFGLSKHYNEHGHQTSFTPTGISIGYAPVEQYNFSELSEFSPTTDIYALAATMYHLITGKVPPASSIVGEKGLPNLPILISDGVKQAITKSMQMLRKDRPQTIAEFLKIMDGTGVAPTTATKVDTQKQNSIKTEVAAPQAQQKPTPAPTSNSASRIVPNKSSVAYVPPANDIFDTKKKKKRTWLWILLAIVLIGGWNVYTGYRAKKADIKNQIEAQQKIANTEVEEANKNAKGTNAVENVTKPAPPSTKQTAKQESQMTPEQAARKAEQERINKMVSQGLGRDGVYKIGDYYNRDGKEGVVFEVADDGRSGKIVSLKEAELKWYLEDNTLNLKEIRANSLNNGKKNTDKMMARADSDKFLAAQWCVEMGDGWYLPALNEMETLGKNIDEVHKTMKRLKNADEFEPHWYWTSTENGSHHPDFFATIYNVGMLMSGYNSKENINFVRAVAVFEN